MIVLNTNLYYENNNETISLEDPGGQFQWLQDILTHAADAGEKVFFIVYGIQILQLKKYRNSFKSLINIWKVTCFCYS